MLVFYTLLSYSENHRAHKRSKFQVPTSRFASSLRRDLQKNQFGEERALHVEKHRLGGIWGKRIFQKLEFADLLSPVLFPRLNKLASAAKQAFLPLHCSCALSPKAAPHDLDCYLQVFINPTFCFHRMVISLVYYAVSFSAGTFGGNRYLVFFLTSLVELPSNWTCIILCRK